MDCTSLLDVLAAAMAACSFALVAYGSWLCLAFSASRSL
jgi:hypothetical protein